MKMLPTGDGRARQDGFTLIEVIAVLLVLAIVAGLASARFLADRSGDVLQATAYEVASRCRHARAAAIRRGTPQVVRIDLASRQVAAGDDGATLSIPATITIDTDTSASEQYSPSIAGIRFFPTGASTGGKLRLQAGRRAYEIRVNWFTGRVSVEPSL
jgi:general secretion pathway protein H